MCRQRRAEIPFAETVTGPLTGMLAFPIQGFRWAGGYEPDPMDRPSAGQMQPGPWLVFNGTDERVLQRRYAVMTTESCRDLHRTFARLARHGPDSFPRHALRFANRFGWLGDRPDRAVLRRPSLAGTGHWDYCEGESWIFWQEMAMECAGLIALWDEATKDAAAARTALGQFVRWQESPREVTIEVGLRAGRLVPRPVPFDVDWRREDNIAVEWHRVGDYRLRRLAAGDVVGATRMFLYDEVNKKLAAHVIPRLYHERPREDALMFAPRTLIGAIYLHFAREMAGRSHPSRACADPRCHETFVPDHGKRRYCSDACRKRADYDRHQPERVAAVRQRRTGDSTTPITTPKPANDHGRQRTE